MNDYIIRQRTLLERIKAGISSLESLKDITAQDPDQLLRRVLDGENDDDDDDGDDDIPRFEDLNDLLHDVREEETGIVGSIEWDLYNGHGVSFVLSRHISLAEW